MNHTIRLINDNAIEGIHSLIHKNEWVDSVVTSFNMDYFYEDTFVETFTKVVQHLSAVLIEDGTVYLRIDMKDIPRVSHIFDICGFQLRNILTIPILGRQIPCAPTKYIDENLQYVLFFTRKKTINRRMNPTTHSEDTCNCKYSANWDWFKGTLIDAYRTMIKISTDHGQTILDPFMNFGDVGEAAILQDRHFIGIEVGRARLDDARRRLDDLGE